MVQVQVQFTPQGATRLAPHVMYGFLKCNSTVYIYIFFFFLVYSMLNACMLANTSLLVLRSSGFERGRLYTQFSTLSTIEKNSFMRPCSASVSWESSRQKISEIEAKPIKWHHFLRAHSFFFPRTVFVRMSAKNIVRMSAQKPSTYHQPVHSHPSEEREGMWLGDTIRSRLWLYPFVPSFCLVVG